MEHARGQAIAAAVFHVSLGLLSLVMVIGLCGSSGDVKRELRYHLVLQKGVGGNPHRDSPLTLASAGPRGLCCNALNFRGVPVAHHNLAACLTVLHRKGGYAVVHAACCLSSGL